MAAGCLRYLHLAELSPAFALLILEVAEAEPELLQRIGAFVQTELRAGIRDNDFAPQREAAAIDLVIGGIMRGMRRIAQGSAPRSYRADITLAMHHTQGDMLDPDSMRAMALHEIGHLLGLDHTRDSLSIMAPRVRVRQLSSADRATIHLLYALPTGPIR